MRESAESIEARTAAVKRAYGRKYQDPMNVTIAQAKATKAAGREPSGYGIALCDDIACDVCRKGKNEKAPWNRTPAISTSAKKFRKNNL